MISTAYRSLVDLRIQEKRTDEALRIWQEYRALNISQSRSYGWRKVESNRQRRSSQPLIVYAGLPGALYAWLVSGKTVEAIPLMEPYEDVSRLGSIFSEECSSPSTDIKVVSESGKRLYQILFKPFEHRILDGEKISIEPDDSLGRIPFGALIDERGRYFNTVHAIEILPFSPIDETSLPSLGAIRAEDPALLVENRGADVGSPEDPESAHEIQTVATVFSNSTILGANWDARNRFIELLKRTSIFHYAGHSGTSSRGASLVIQEKIATGKTHSIFVSSEDLNGVKLEHARLAVLSACQTDIGQGSRWRDRENISITLLQLGFSEVVASRWNIDSVASTSLMRQFYTDIAKGWGTAESLRDAEEQISRIPRYQHPYFWAGFWLLSARR